MVLRSSRERKNRMKRRRSGMAAYLTFESGDFYDILKRREQGLVAVAAGASGQVTWRLVSTETEARTLEKTSAARI